MLLDLNLALERAKKELNNPLGVRNLFVFDHGEFQKAVNNQSLFVQNLNGELVDGFQPEGLDVVEVPKPSGLVRPGVFMSLKDRVVYNALVGNLLSAVIDEIGKAPQFDFALPLATTDPQDVTWQGGYLDGWLKGRSRAADLAASGQFSHVLKTDVTGYYEYIHIDFLLKKLETLGSDKQVLRLLGRCLKQWSVLGDRGIPQGCRASSVLGKIYLHAVDLEIEKSGYKHTRYVDDFLVFCKSESDARRALLKMSRTLKEHGLSLSAEKTQIRPIQSLNNLNKRNTNKQDKETLPELVNGLEEDDLSMSEAVIAQILDCYDLKEITEETIKKLFVKYTRSENFDSSVFRFLLGLMGKRKMDFAFLDCFQRLHDPQQICLQIPTLMYFATLPQHRGMISRYLIRLLHSDIYGLYPFLVYQALLWLNEYGEVDKTGVDTLQNLSVSWSDYNQKLLAFMAV